MSAGVLAQVPDVRVWYCLIKKKNYKLFPCSLQPRQYPIQWYRYKYFLYIIMLTVLHTQAIVRWNGILNFTEI